MLRAIATLEGAQTSVDIDGPICDSVSVKEHM
jgi:hypothetical protein